MFLGAVAEPCELSFGKLHGRADGGEFTVHLGPDTVPGPASVCSFDLARFQFVAW